MKIDTQAGRVANEHASAAQRIRFTHPKNHHDMEDVFQDVFEMRPP